MSAGLFLHLRVWYQQISETPGNSPIIGPACCTVGQEQPRCALHTPPPSDITTYSQALPIVDKDVKVWGGEAKDICP